MILFLPAGHKKIDFYQSEWESETANTNRR